MFIPNIFVYPILFVVGVFVIKAILKAIYRRFCFRRPKVGFKRTCLVTGGSRGIGFELAKLFLEDEYNLLIVARNLKKLETSRSELVKMFPKNRIDTFRTDLSASNGVKKLIEELKSEKLKIDVLVNNAGRYLVEYFEKKDVDEWINLVKLNNLSTVRLTHYCLR